MKKLFISILLIAFAGLCRAGVSLYPPAPAPASKTTWQNPASASQWTWTSDGTQITLTGYSGPADVVIPDTLDNLPVTRIGTIFSGVAITSISGGENVGSIDISAFFNCDALTSLILPAATNIGDGAFADCTVLTSVTLPAATNIGAFAFNRCPALTSVTLPAATSISDYAFYICDTLRGVYFGQNAPAEAEAVYDDTPSVTNYVTNPTATGWGATWNGRPVVRLPVYADTFAGGGTGITNIPLAGVSGLVDALAGKLGTNATPGDIGAVASTPAGIAAAGGVVASTILQPGEFNLGTNTTVSIATNFVCFTANVTSTWTLAIDASTPRYPRDLIIIGTNGSIIPSYVIDARTGSAGATNLYYVRPWGTEPSTNWFLK